MRTMTKERKKEGPRLKGKGRADTKASRQLLLLCIPAIIGYILFNYIPMGAAVIIPFKNYKFSKGILGSDWCGLANFKWIIQSVALDRALRNTVLYGLLFMVLSPVTNVIIALLLFEITSRRRLKTYQTIITFPNFMSMVIKSVGFLSASYDELAKKYDPEKLHYGYNPVGGEEIYYIPNPALGLWINREKFEG